MADTHHLICRDGRWYYHRRVPKSLRSKFGPVIKASLVTTDKKQAIKLREIRDVEWSARFEAAETAGAGSQQPVSEAINAAVMTEPLALRLVHDYVDRTDRLRREQWIAGEPRDNDARAAAIEGIDFTLAVASGQAPRYDIEEFISRTIETIVSPAKVVFDEATYPSTAFYGLVKRALVEVLHRAAARANDESPAFFDDLFNPSAPKPVTVAELTEQFLTYEIEKAKGRHLSEKHIDKVRSSLKLVEELLGPTTLVRNVDFDTCRDFCTKLAALPPNRTKIYGSLPIAQVLKKAKLEARPTLSFITQQQHLAVLKRLLAQGVSKCLLPSNPAATLVPIIIDEVAAEDKRRPFDADQLIAFFHSSFYVHCGSKGPSPFEHADKSWRFWLPLLALFLGMRPREICQLHVADIQRTKKGTWFINVEATKAGDNVAEIEAKTTKTKRSRRCVPLHPQLERIGFLRFVAEQKALGDSVLLFRGITRNTYGDPAAYPLRRFNETYIPEAMQLKPRQSFYSFRHSWRDAVRSLNPPADFLQAVGAWELGLKTSDKYGSYEHPDRYAPYMAAIEFEGLDLSHLYIDTCLCT